MRVFFPPYPFPFPEHTYYFIPYRWLADVSQAQECDTRELLMYAHVPDTGEIQFPEEQPIAFWVRANDGGYPLLMSHVTFNNYLRRIAIEAPPRQKHRPDPREEENARPAPAAHADTAESTQPALPEMPLVERQGGPADWFFIREWPTVCEAGVIYKPRAYLERRWPLRLGSHNLAARAALLAFFDMATHATPEESDRLVLHEASSAQIRRRILSFMPKFGEGHRVAENLQRLERLGLLESVRQVASGKYYRLVPAGFDRTPIATDSEIASQCGLHPVHEIHWIDLIQEFLSAQCRPPEDCIVVWEQIRRYQDEVATAEDVEEIIGIIRSRGRRRSTAIPRVFKDFLGKRRAYRHWERSHPFGLTVMAGAITEATTIVMPALVGQDIHLRCTQLVLRIQRSTRLSKADAARILTGVELTIVQGPARFTVIDALRVTKKDVDLGKIVDCNHLHGQLDYAQPFDLQLRKRDPAEGATSTTRQRMEAVQMVGYFRVDATGRR